MSKQNQHLWEMDHPYYAAEGSEYLTFKSWQEFVEEWADADYDMNYLYRWDVDQIEFADEKEKKAWTKALQDPYYRGFRIKITFILQRKSRFITCVAEFCQYDEPEIKAYLNKHWEHICLTWEGIS